MKRLFTLLLYFALAPMHNAGAFAFLSPGLMQNPGAADVIGVVRNFGTEEETYDVHCVVNDPTFAIVLDTLISVITPAGENDTIIFGNIDFISGHTYDLMMETMISGNPNPGNDTLSQSTYCTSWYWESFANMPAARSGPYAGWYYDPTGDGALYIHVFGGGSGSAPSVDHYIWDAATDSWTVSSDQLPIGSYYGGHVTVGDKVYMIGARQGFQNYIVIYDILYGEYTAVPIPYGSIGDPAVAVYQNKYIYSFGGCRPSGWIATTIVFAYDTEADTFFEPTQLPASDARTCATAAIINDTAYVAGGIDEGGNYTNEFLVGYINPADPANITWTVHGTTKPGSAVCRLNGGPVFDDAGNGVFYIAGGDAGPVCVAETYLYTPNLGWRTLPDKITAVSNWARAIAPADVSDDAEWIMYAAGGYSPYQAVFEGLHTGTITSIEEMPNDQVNVFALFVTSTNPVTDQASFSFSMPFRCAVNFRVYDVTGRQVLDSQYSNISQGEHTLFWDLKDNSGRNVASGTYFYKVEVGDYHAEGKLVVVR